MTFFRIALQSSASISTHTLTWSVTSNGNMISTAKVISTHTLTWSVTFVILAQVVIVNNFNSHAHVERDFALCDITSLCTKFQLTRSRGA